MKLSSAGLSVALAALVLGTAYFAIGATERQLDTLCYGYSGLPSGQKEHAGMVKLSGGRFSMGSAHFYPEERPVVEVSVASFWIDRHPVTNAQFKAFVEATGYVTQAERGLSESQAAGLPPSAKVPGSLVFVREASAPGWQFLQGASWKTPQGPGSTIEDKMNHPVVQVTYNDAKAYADWLGRELPSEAQLEYAARGGLKGATYAWGDKPFDHARPQANTWQGNFPLNDSGFDGYKGTSPVGCYAANAFGLFDVGGNVWEFTRSWYRPGHEITVTENPEGPDSSLDPRDPGTPVKVIKGGSHLCSENYCLRYRPSARQPQPTYLGTSHIGFRTISIGS